MSKHVYIRSLANVNSQTMRAIRKILQTPGLTVPKVCILVGGPDWPTSVTTGILRCSLVEMLTGTLPVLFLIAPCTLAGRGPTDQPTDRPTRRVEPFLPLIY